MVSPRRNNAQDEQERSFRELIKLSNQAKIIKRNQRAQEGSQWAQQEYNDRQVQQNVEAAKTTAPDKSMFGFLDKAIPDVIEKPATEALKTAYGIYEFVPELIPY